MKKLTKDDYLGLQELLDSGVDPGDIYVFGAPGSSPDWGLYDPQAFTRDEALEMFKDWYEVYRDHPDRTDDLSLDEYVDALLDELKTVDQLWLPDAPEEE